ncbi:MAG TPA: hypothetical protein VFE24_07305 [Pirellulales bacterium]|jgi:hypothetical protein|nr:hypothetical protein [Pirellulales bacterium]
MSDDFDPYREALVVEQLTHWPAEYDQWDPAAKVRVEALLHAEPQAASTLDYVRQHTGFRREITVTSADLARLGVVA